MSPENVEIMRWIDSEWRKGNIRAGIDLYDRWVLFIPRADYPDAEPKLGTESVKQWMRRWIEGWTNFTITADELIDAGDSVVVGLRQRGNGVESGAPVEIRHFEVWTFRGGRVVRREQFHGRDEALEAVGLKEQPAVSQENAEVVRRVYAGWEKGDFSDVAWAAPDIEFVPAEPAAEAVVGVAAMGAAWREWLPSWDSFSAVADDIHAMGEHVLVTTSFRGYGKASGLSAQQLSHLPGVALFTFRGSQVVRLALYTHREDALRALGLSE